MHNCLYQPNSIGLSFVQKLLDYHSSHLALRIHRQIIQREIYNRLMITVRTNELSWFVFSTHPNILILLKIMHRRGSRLRTGSGAPR